MTDDVHDVHDDVARTARGLRIEMLRSRVPVDAFVVGPDHAGSVGVGSLDVYGDGALAFLRSVGRDTLPGGGIVVRGKAPEVSAFLQSLDAFVPERLVGMIGTDVAGVPRPPLPDGLRLSDVRFGPLIDPALPAAADFAAALEAADPVARPGTMLPLLDWWSDLPVRLLVAVDAEGAVRATSAGMVSGPIWSSTRSGMVFGVSTEPGWRGRGVGTAMTAAAVHAAADLGATAFVLDATASGASIYRRLGFVAYAPVVAWHPRG